MREAVSLARKAHLDGFSPVGAVLVKDDEIISTSSSRREIGNLLHAEYLLVNEHAAMGLVGMSLYTTLEPCVMCGGMATVGKIDRVLYILDDLWGGWHSCTNKESDYIMSRETVIEKYDNQAMYDECKVMLSRYLTDQGHSWAIERMLNYEARP